MRRLRKLGNVGLEVSPIGLGCMGMSEFYGRADSDEGVATIHRALDLGVTFLDTADAYGPFTNERLVGRAIAGRRDDVVLVTKFGNVRGENGERLGIRGDAEYVRQACDTGSPRRTTSSRTTSAGTAPASRATTSSATWTWSSGSRRSPQRRASRRRSSPCPGTASGR